MDRKPRDRTSRPRAGHLRALVAAGLAALIVAGSAGPVGAATLRPDVLTADLNQLALEGGELLTALHLQELSSAALIEQLASIESAAGVYLTDVEAVYATVNAAVAAGTTFAVSDAMLLYLDTLSTIAASLGGELSRLSDELRYLAPALDYTALQSAVLTLRRLDAQISITAGRIEEMGDKVLIIADNVAIMADRMRASRQVMGVNLRAFYAHVGLVRIHAITATAEPGGTITPSGTVPVLFGQDQTFTIAASTGFQIADVVVDGVSKGRIASYTFVAVSTDHSITAKFTAAFAAVTVLQPNGGEVIPSGSSYTVLWGAPATAVTFDIAYSLNSGKNWTVAAKGVTGTSYAWRVPTPATNTATCLIKVTGYTAAGVVVGSDISNKVFTIEVVRLTAPNGGEILRQGTVFTIAWMTNGTALAVNKVILSYSTNGGKTYVVIATLTGNPGVYAWTVPAVTSSTCRAKVALYNGNTLLGSDTSNAVFTIAR